MCCMMILQADEREQKARDFMRAEMRYHKAREDKKTKELQIVDHKKKYQEMMVKWVNYEYQHKAFSVEVTKP